MNCEAYLQDPDQHETHLETCVTCRELFAELDAEVAVTPRPIAVDSLPLAAWEGASHRTWPLVAAGFAAISILAVALFIAAGTPPLRGIARAVASSFTSFEAASKFFQLFGNGLHSAPAVVHVTVGVLFVAINSLLFILLRRAPKGIDV
jgi:hypothetical protein